MSATRKRKIPTPWEFLSDDDEPMEEDLLSPEVAAMHVQRAGHPQPARDVGRSDVELGPASDHGDAPADDVTYFDDEVSETEEGEELAEDNHDIEDLLIVQHYLPSDEAD